MLIIQATVMGNSRKLKCFAFELAGRKDCDPTFPFKVRRFAKKIQHKMQTSVNGEIASLCFLHSQLKRKALYLFECTLWEARMRVHNKQPTGLWREN